MRQVAKRLKDGRLELIEVPDPMPAPGEVAIAVEASVISSGTERATLAVAEKGLLAKARARPEQARQVIERARQEGVRSTIELVRRRLGEFSPLGYSAAGRVVEAGAGVRGLAPGDLVAAAGGGVANHAELDVVPSLLCAPVPDGVTAEDAAFTTLAAVALHGFRQCEVAVGGTIAVIGLGLIGQLAVRICLAAGCNVRAIDLDPELVELAARAGADGRERSLLEGTEEWSGGADAVMVCAATPSSDPVVLAARLARDRGIVTIVGDVGLEIPRAPYYEKELQLRLARSYGPGRYDPDYELHGIDYPIGHARWTIRRNMEAVLGLVASGALKPAELVSASFAIDEAEQAFEVVREGGSLAVVLSYPRRPTGPSRHADRAEPTAWRPRTDPVAGVIGAGAFATSTLIPGLARAGLRLGSVASASGLSARNAERELGFETSSADPQEVIESDADLIAIATRHDSHAELAARALEAGKAVYVEKPLAIDAEGLARVVEAQRASGAPLFVGFNRVHSPLLEPLRELPRPMLGIYRVNAGQLPVNHWTNDVRIGGGRLVGEGCHFIDFLCQLAGSDPLTVHAQGFPSHSELPVQATDNFTVSIRFAGGSTGSLHYVASAPRGPGKERFEFAGGGTTAVLDDFRTLEIWKGSKRSRHGGRSQQKGFGEQFESVASVLRGETEPPDPARFIVPSLATLAAVRSLEAGTPQPVISPG